MLISTPVSNEYTAFMHIEQSFTWLSACCMLLLLGYMHNHTLLLCFAIVIMMLGCFDSVVIFWTTCWRTNLVWASICLGHNFNSHGMLFVNVNKYSSTIRRIRGRVFLALPCIYVISSRTWRVLRRYINVRRAYNSVERIRLQTKVTNRGKHQLHTNRDNNAANWRRVVP